MERSRYKFFSGRRLGEGLREAVRRRKGAGGLPEEGENISRDAEVSVLRKESRLVSFNEHPPGGSWGVDGERVRETVGRGREPILEVSGDRRMDPKAVVLQHTVQEKRLQPKA
jgi:hypothetical protein